MGLYYMQGWGVNASPAPPEACIPWELLAFLVLPLLTLVLLLLVLLLQLPGATLLPSEVCSWQQRVLLSASVRGKRQGHLSTSCVGRASVTATPAKSPAAAAATLAVALPPLLVVDSSLSCDSMQ